MLFIVCAAMSAHAAELKWTSAGDMLRFSPALPSGL